MEANELAFMPVHELIERLSARDTTPAALMRSLLDRIERHNEKLHAFTEVYAEDALRAAEAAGQAISAGHQIGPLHGIPVVVKDIVEIDGRITTGGSAVWRERRSTYTATLVERMIAAGMIVIGKTHSVEFAMGGWGTNQRLGTPWNPWDLVRHRTPGGSSAGTGVAVAAGFAPWGIGTDTGGSVRIPAGWCGLAGLKTTVGRISTHGVLPLSHTLDTPGPLARSVEDAALLFDVLHGADPNDLKTRGLPPSQPLGTLKRGIRGLRLAVMPPSEREGVDGEVLASFDASIEVLKSLGSEVELLARLPRTFSDFAERTGRIIFTEGYSYVGDLCDDPNALVDEDVRPRILAGKQYSARAYLDGLREREVIKAEFDVALEGFDALLTPTMLTPAIPLEEVDQAGTPAGFTRAVNYLDRAAVTVPNGFTSASSEASGEGSGETSTGGIDGGGLPSGLQFVCDAFAEATALRLAWTYEQATDWHKRHPSGLD